MLTRRRLGRLLVAGSGLSGFASRANAQAQEQRKDQRSAVMAYTPGRPFLITIDRTDGTPFKAVTRARCDFQPRVIDKEPGAIVPWIWLPDKTRLSPDRKRVTLFFVPPAPLVAQVPDNPLPPLPCKTIPPVPGKNLPAAGSAQTIQLKTAAAAYSQQESQSGPGTIVVVIDDDGQPDDPTDPIDVEPIDVDPCG